MKYYTPSKREHQSHSWLAKIFRKFLQASINFQKKHTQFKIYGVILDEKAIFKFYFEKYYSRVTLWRLLQFL